MPGKRKHIVREICTGELVGSSNKSQLVKSKKYKVVYTYIKGLFQPKVISIKEHAR